MTQGLNKWHAIPLSFTLILMIWYVASWIFAPDEGSSLVLLPAPHVVLSELYGLLIRDNFVKDIFLSVGRILLGVLVASIPAFGLGMWFGMQPKVHSLATPLFAFAKYIRPVAFVPLLILWLGIGLKQQTALLFIGIFFHLTIDTADTVAKTPQAILGAARTLGVNGFRLVFKIVLPNAIPDLIQHLRTMVGIAWTYLVVVEMVGAGNGIGHVIVNAQRFLATGKVIAGMLTIGLLGIGCDYALRGMSKILCRWKNVNA